MRRVIFRSPEELFDRAAAFFARRAAEAIGSRGRFAVALSGGTTPLPLYARLASEPYPTEIDWPRVHVFWGDERCVPTDHPASNYRAAREAVLDHVPLPPENVHRIFGELSPDRAAERYRGTLDAQLGREGRLDLVLLGVGRDGHTASLFPGDPALEEEELDAVTVVHPGGEHPRVTLTFPALRRARETVILAVGKEKRDIVRRIDAGEVLPAALAVPEDGEVLWLLDRDAAP